MKEAEMAKILVVEDNRDYQELLQNFLENAAHVVTTAGDGTQAIELTKSYSFDLILLDLMLPGVDGFGVCAAIREICDTPIIMLTALDSETCQLRGYELLIDDYITKPVSMTLLLQKVEAVLRRTMPLMSIKPSLKKSSEVLCFGDISLNLRAHTVLVANNPVSLTLREFEILRELMQAPGTVVTRKTLIEKLWGYDFSMDNARVVDTHMKNIRQKLARSDCKSDYIETVRGVGYKLRRDCL